MTWTPLVLFVLLTILAAVMMYRGKHLHALTLVVLLGFGLHLWSAMDPELHDWDEQYHALVAKNIWDDPVKPVLYKEALLPYYYTDWTRNHIWLHKPPLPLWLIGGSIKVFGLNPLAVRVPSLLLFVVSIFAMFRIATYFGGARVGIVAAWLLSINGLINDLGAGRANTDHYDSILLSLTLIGGYFALRHVRWKGGWSLLMVGIITGLCVLTKWLPGLMLIGIWFLFMIKEKQGFKSILLGGIGIAAVATLVAAPWFFYIHEAFPLEAEFQSIQNWRRALRGDVHHTGEWWYYFDKIGVNYSWLFYPALLILPWIRSKNWRDFLVLFVWVAIPVTIFSIAKIKTPAYIITAAPALFIVMAYVVTLGVTSLKQRGIQWMLGVLLAVALAMPGVERMQLGKARIQPVHDWTVLQQELNAKTVVVEELHYPKVMFYTDAIAYRDTLPIDMEQYLLDKGYAVTDLKGQ